MAEDNQERPERVIVEERVGAPGAWTVEAYFEDGAIEQAIFIGPRAEERAREYREREYPDATLAPG